MVIKVARASDSTLSGRRLGASTAELARLTGLNRSTVSRRYDSAMQKPGHYKISLSELQDAYKTKRIARLHD
jgi:DNA-binding transcriptional regulator YhcF (GntR family)